MSGPHYTRLSEHYARCCDDSHTGALLSPALAFLMRLLDLDIIHSHSLTARCTQRRHDRLWQLSAPHNPARKKRADCRVTMCQSRP